MKNFKHYTALYAIPWITLLGGWWLGALAGKNSETAGAWLLLASALLFGLPHGAYDFWILFDQTAPQPHRKSAFAGVLAAYLMLALFIAGIWYFLPGIALIGFLALTAWHFGSGDAIWESDKNLDWLLNSCGRGLLIISAPLAFYPQQSGLVLTKLDPNSAETLIRLAPYTLSGGIFLLLINTFFILLQNRKTNNRKLPLRLETMILLLFFWLTTPLLAVAVYLIGVHSWRHLLRLNVYEQTAGVFENNNLWRSICRFHCRALPLTIFSLIGAALIIWFWQLRISSLAEQTSAYLVLLSALTVPHAALITRTEWQQRKTRRFRRMRESPIIIQ